MIRGASLSLLVFALACAATDDDRGAGDSTTGGSTDDGADDAVSATTPTGMTTPTTLDDDDDDGDEIETDPSADDESSEDGSSEGTTEAGSSEGSTDDGTGLCATTDDCADDEVCWQDACDPASAHSYDVLVTYFAPPRCGDGVGGAENFVEFYFGGVLAATTGNSECPSSWPDESAVYDGSLGFRLVFIEDDPVFNDEIAAICWDDECGRVPAEVLHDGAFAGIATGRAGDFDVELVFELIE
jgi:hypothetical protein